VDATVRLRIWESLPVLLVDPRAAAPPRYEESSDALPGGCAASFSSSAARNATFLLALI